MSLHNLWRLRFAFAALLAAEGTAATVAGLRHLWTGPGVGIAAAVCFASALALVPWQAADRPPSPGELPHDS